MKRWPSVLAFELISVHSTLQNVEGVPGKENGVKVKQREM
jgi:hypothetical protein